MGGTRGSERRWVGGVGDGSDGDDWNRTGKELTKSDASSTACVLGLVCLFEVVDAWDGEQLAGTHPTTLPSSPLGQYFLSATMWLYFHGLQQIFLA